MNRKPLSQNPVIAILWSLLYFAIFRGCQLATSLAFSLIVPIRVVAKNPLLGEAELMRLAETELLACLDKMSIVSAVITVVIFWFIAFFRKRPLEQEVGLYRVSFTSLCSVSAIAIAAVYVISLALSCIPERWLTGYNEQMTSMLDAEGSLAFLSTVVVAPIVEEITFRAMMYGTLSRTMPPWVAMLLSSLVFGAAHGNIIQGAYAFLHGMLLAWICYRFGSVIPCIMLHMVFNLFGSYSQMIFNRFQSVYSTVLLLGLAFAIPAILHIIRATRKTPPSPPTNYFR